MKAIQQMFRALELFFPDKFMEVKTVPITDKFLVDLLAWFIEQGDLPAFYAELKATDHLEQFIWDDEMDTENLQHLKKFIQDTGDEVTFEILLDLMEHEFYTGICAYATSGCWDSLDEAYREGWLFNAISFEQPAYYTPFGAPEHAHSGASYDELLEHYAHCQYDDGPVARISVILAPWVDDAYVDEVDDWELQDLASKGHRYPLLPHFAAELGVPGVYSDNRFLGRYTRMQTTYKEDNLNVLSIAYERENLRLSQKVNEMAQRKFTIAEFFVELLATKKSKC